MTRWRILRSGAARSSVVGMVIITPPRGRMLESLVFQESNRKPENDIRRELYARIRLGHLLAAMNAPCGDRNHVPVISDREFCPE